MTDTQDNPDMASQSFQAVTTSQFQAIYDAHKSAFPDDSAINSNGGLLATYVAKS